MIYMKLRETGGFIYKAIYYSLIPKAVRNRVSFLHSPRYLQTDVFGISFPKCGRTWLKLILGKTFALHYDINLEVDVQTISDLHEHQADIPYIRFKHDNFRRLAENPETSPTREGFYSGKSILYLYRDPRDVTVSWYHHTTKRNNEFDGDFDDFIDKYSYGPEVIARFYNRWSRKLDELPETFSLRYESLHLEPFPVLKEVFKFLNHSQISDETIQQAYNFSSFNNMRKMEKNQESNSFRLQPGDPDDHNSYKTRKGKIGSYKEELNEQQVKKLNNLFKNNLDSMYLKHYDFS